MEAHFGWSIEYFRDILEVLRVVHDVIQGHKDLYTKGVLHRDVRLGNMSIFCVGSDITVTKGCLLDLDCAKVSDIFKNPDITPGNLDMDSEHQLICGKAHKPGLDDQALRALYSQVRQDDAPGYVRFIIMEKPELQDRVLTREDLELYPLPQQSPDFSSREPDGRKRTGTGPFMSGELLLERVYVGRHRDIIHESIHDMESVMWVVLYLCCNQLGCGLDSCSKLEHFRTSELLELDDRYFDTIDLQYLGQQKAALFREPDRIEEIIRNLHPYYKPLEGMIRSWLKILRRRYEFGMVSNVHDEFLAVVNRTISEVNQGIL